MPDVPVPPAPAAAPAPAALRRGAVVAAGVVLALGGARLPPPPALASLAPADPVPVPAAGSPEFPSVLSHDFSFDCTYYMITPLQ